MDMVNWGSVLGQVIAGVLIFILGLLWAGVKLGSQIRDSVRDLVRTMGDRDDTDSVLGKLESQRHRLEVLEREQRDIREWAIGNGFGRRTDDRRG